MQNNSRGEHDINTNASNYLPGCQKAQTYQGLTIKHRWNNAAARERANRQAGFVYKEASARAKRPAFFLGKQQRHEITS